MNNIPVCFHCINSMLWMLKDKYEYIFDKNHMNFRKDIKRFMCKYCDWRTEQLDSSLHHCIIPMKNKYMNINVL